MSRVCTPVSVVTAVVDGRPHGTTVSAFTSLSADPPMILVALDRRSRLLALVERTRRLGINVLGTEHVDLARRFAQKGADTFAGVGWTLDHGLPRFRSCPAWLACAVDSLVNGGDHVVVLARIEAAALDAAQPLTYHSREFGTHMSIVPADEATAPDP
jgi:flavin reductase (DIM6/NTAB) family NADH-FMN oxidoreductase RutF